MRLEKSQEFNNWAQSTSIHLDLMFETNNPEPKKEKFVKEFEKNAADFVVR